MTLLYQLVEEQSADVPRKRVYIVSHRANTLQGVKDYVPENSIKMIEMAIAAGSDMVELDVRPTKDGELILMHDETIDRTTTGKGKVSSMTYAEILKYDLKRSTEVSEGMKVPTMREALLACKGHIFVNLDIANKNVPVAQCAALIKELGMTDQVMIYSGKDELLIISQLIRTSSSIRSFTVCRMRYHTGSTRALCSSNILMRSMMLRIRCLQKR
jgi:glycerophosphoryl diester phosphodiesterase